jgi:mRNA interferase MazF
VIGRGGIYWVDFHDSVGAEIRKCRPAVVVSSNGHNAHMRTVTVVPFSSPNTRVSLYEVAVPEGVVGDGRPSRLRTHQLRAVDKERLGRKMGTLPARLMRALEASLLEHLGIGI